MVYHSNILNSLSSLITNFLYTPLTNIPHTESIFTQTITRVHETLVGSQISEQFCPRPVEVLPVTKLTAVPNKFTGALKKIESKMIANLKCLAHSFGPINGAHILLNIIVVNF